MAELKQDPGQAAGSKWLAERKVAFLGDEMGYGKSNQIVKACDLIKAKNILIICPGIARRKWVEDFEMWQSVPRLAEPVMSTKMVPNADVVIVSYHLIRRLPVLKALFRRKWDVIAVDEARALKNPNAAQTRAVYGNKTDANTGLASRGNRIWIADGTLLPNHVGELFTHANALFKDVDPSCTTYNQWVEKYCERAAHSDAIVGTKKVLLPLLIEKMKPHTLRRKVDRSKMPPLTVDRYPVLPDKLLKKPEGLSEIEYVIAGAMARLSKDPDADELAALKEVKETHVATLRKYAGLCLAPSVTEIIKSEIEQGLGSYIIFANHSEVIEYFKKELPDSAVIYGKTPQGDKPGQRDYILNAWSGNVPGYKPKGLILNYVIASSALNLIEADRAFLAEFPWVPSEIDQAIFRAWRRGQKKPVRATMYSLAGSVHDSITKALLRKMEVTNKFNEELTSR